MGGAGLVGGVGRWVGVVGGQPRGWVIASSRLFFFMLLLSLLLPLVQPTARGRPPREPPAPLHTHTPSFLDKFNISKILFYK